MKFQLKALAAALALVAAVPAQAAIDSTVTGNGSLILTVFDSANNISALFDLGLNYADFSLTGTSFPASNALSANYTWNLTANGLNNGKQGDYATAWSTFAATANEAGASWAVVAADNLGAGAGSRGFISTIANSAAPVATLNSNQTVAIGGNLAVYTDAAGVAGVDAGNYSNHATSLNGANVSLINTNGYYLPYYLADKNNNTGAIAIGAINSSLDVIQRTTGASGIVQSSQTIFGNGAKFTLTSAGQLSYTTLTAPIPEADTWAMMLLGLGFMGFVARRKQA
jgi:PEP-CTERM motif